MGAETRIGETLFDQMLDDDVIDPFPLALDIGSVSSALDVTLVGMDAEDGEFFQNLFLRSFHFPFLVGILESHKKDSCDCFASRQEMKEADNEPVWRKPVGDGANLVTIAPSGNALGGNRRSRSAMLSFISGNINLASSKLEFMWIPTFSMPYSTIRNSKTPPENVLGGGFVDQ
jgi:hypothetical protein